MEMEKSSLQETDQFAALNPFQTAFGAQPTQSSQLNALNASKKAKSKVKPIRGLPSTVRVGDWVCLICNNLNFSFRSECNRCQIQTKEQNQIQTIQISDPQTTQNNMQNRLPFQDLTNQNFIQNRFGPAGTHTKSKSTPIESELKLHHNLRLMINKQSAEADGSSSTEFSLNKGFQNMLLVTPPKHGQTKSFTIFKEYSDSGQKELPPYQSPKNLPSVSPMLKRVFGHNLKEDEERNDEEFQNLTFSTDYAEEAPQSPVTRKPKELSQTHDKFEGKYENFRPNGQIEREASRNRRQNTQVFNFDKRNNAESEYTFQTESL